MSNDLISRSALKKKIEEVQYTQEFCIEHKIDYSVSMQMLGMAIDNAPTVEPFEPDYVGAERLKARQRGYEEGYHRGMEIGKTLNPKIKQGEWIYIGQRNGLKVVECTNCHKRQYGSMKYCGNCGADMRGEKNESSFTV